MRKHSQDTVPFKAKVCTVVSGVVVVASVSFSVYAGFPDSTIPDKDNPLWGILVILVMLVSVALWVWGWGWMTIRKRRKEVMLVKARSAKPVCNEICAINVLRKLQFEFTPENRQTVRTLLQDELLNYQAGSSEYLRMLCGFLFCIGNPEDAELISRVKWGINMDVGCMVDGDWLDELEGKETDFTRYEMVKEYIRYYTEYME